MRSFKRKIITGQYNTVNTDRIIHRKYYFEGFYNIRIHYMENVLYENTSIPRLHMVVNIINNFIRRSAYE